MTPAHERTLYELLDVAPDASPHEIRRAYQELHELYAEDSPGAYSFFTQEDRVAILAQLEDAYLTLIDPPSRFAYDRDLASKGRITEDRLYRDKTNQPISLYAFRRERTARRTVRQAVPAAPEDPLLTAMLQRDTLTGGDLKTIRTAKGVPLDRISFQSKVRLATLQAIEEDRFDFLPPRVYVRGFLKAYALALAVDPDVVAQAYLKHWDAWKEAHP